MAQRVLFHSDNNLPVSSDSQASSANDIRNDRITAYVKRLVGSPYLLSMPIGKTQQNAPFYAYNGPVPRPSRVHKEGINCAGLANLIVRLVGGNVPGVMVPKHVFPGGTSAWFSEFGKFMVPIDLSKNYPVMTILFRKYNDENNQGHIAIVWSSSRGRYVCDQSIVHAMYSAKTGGRVAIEKMRPINDNKKGGGGYYQFTLAPEYWLHSTVCGNEM
jgi:hypothetical protein